MKFDIVTANPPYNDGRSQHGEEAASKEATGNRRKAQKALGLDFINFIIDKVQPAFAGIIAPISRIYTKANKQKFIDRGLYKVENCTDYFKVKAGTIVTYYFNRDVAGELIENIGTFEVPENNLQTIHSCTTSSVWTAGKKDLFNRVSETEGKYKIIMSTTKIRYTDDESIISTMNDKSINKLRVAFQHTGSSFRKPGKMIIAHPGETLYNTVDYFHIESVAQGEAIISLFEKEETLDKLEKIKNTTTNSGKSFSAFEIPSVD